MAITVTTHGLAITEHSFSVPLDDAEETAHLIRGTRAWVTSEYEHNGLRADGATVLGHLLDLVRSRA